MIRRYAEPSLECERCLIDEHVEPIHCAHPARAKLADKGRTTTTIHEVKDRSARREKSDVDGKVIVHQTDRRGIDDKIGAGDDTNVIDRLHSGPESLAQEARTFRRAIVDMHDGTGPRFRSGEDRRGGAARAKNADSQLTSRFVQAEQRADRCLKSRHIRVVSAQFPVGLDPPRIHGTYSSGERRQVVAGIVHPLSYTHLTLPTSDP